jgi:hypothetical protein
MNRVRTVVTVLFLLAPLSAFSQLPAKPAPTQKPKQGGEAKPEMATWNPDIGKISGITQEHFAELGLYRLTKQQFVSLLRFLIEQEASEAARSVQNAPSYTCERIDPQNPLLIRWSFSSSTMMDHQILLAGSVRSFDQSLTCKSYSLKKNQT